MIRVKGLQKSFGTNLAVAGVSFEIHQGETFGLLGPNGAGKTTTIHLLTGLLRPDAGDVSIAGSPDPTRLEVRRQIGVAPQSIALYDRLTGAENVAFLGRLYGLSGSKLRERVDAVLDFAGLSDRRNDRISTYSGGMKRRLNLAAALVHEPAVLFCDEPTAGVDPQSRNHIYAGIKTLARQGKTILPGAILSSFEDVRTKGAGNARQSKLIVGPWAHVSIGVSQQGDLAFPKAANASGEAARIFFDRWLRDLDNGWDKTPQRRVWQIGDERWVEDTPRGAPSRTEELVALGPGGAYTSDPADASPTLGGANLPPLKDGPTDHSPLDSRKDRHVWRVVKALRVNGSPELTFEAAIDKESCDFIARLCEVRDGRPYLLAEAARRVQAKPGVRTRVTLEFPPTAVTTGELRIFLTSTNWPRYARHEGVVAVTVHDGAMLKVPTLR